MDILDGFKQNSADNAQIKKWGSFLHFTLHCFGHLGPIFVQKRCCWCIFNHFVTLQSSEDRTHKQHVSIEGILEGVPVLSGYTTMVGLYPNL